MRFRKGAHSVYYTEYHIVWTPRYRRKLLVDGVKEYLTRYLLDMEELSFGIEVIKLNVQVDHVHLIILIPPRYSVASVVQFMKSRSGKKLKEKFSFMQKAIYGREGIWSVGYCVSTIGLNERAIMEYVEHQEKVDKGQLELNLS